MDKDALEPLPKCQFLEILMGSYKHVYFRREVRKIGVDDEDFFSHKREKGVDACGDKRPTVENAKKVKRKMGVAILFPTRLKILR